MWEYTDNDGKLAKAKQTVKELTGNRKDVRGGKSYEVRFEGMPKEVTFWIRQDPLEEGGWSKLLREVDEKILAREAMYKRPLTQKNVIEHFASIGLGEEFAAHHQMRALSNGQRVKVVIAACMWNLWNLKARWPERSHMTSLVPTLVSEQLLDIVEFKRKTFLLFPNLR